MSVKNLNQLAQTLKQSVASIQAVAKKLGIPLENDGKHISSEGAETV